MPGVTCGPVLFLGLNSPSQPKIPIQSYVRSIGNHCNLVLLMPRQIELGPLSKVTVCSMETQSARLTRIKLDLQCPYQVLKKGTPGRPEHHTVVAYSSSVIE
jgi:hypothetical protein